MGDKNSGRSKTTGTVNQKMKILRKVVGGLRSSVAGSGSQKQDSGMIEETLRSEHFQIGKTVRHGFPFHPTAIAHDPVQNLLAIGTRTGVLRIFGRPEAQCDVKHEGNFAITRLIFLVNEGALLSVSADDQIHMWTLRQKKPEIVHSLKFQRERITYCHLPFQSKWLYIGTERGNVHIVNLESFTLSGYIINWNKAMELIRMQHPGAVVHLSDNPMDSSKLKDSCGGRRIKCAIGISSIANREQLLIGFELGSVVLWDLRNKVAETRFTCTETLRSVCWHHEGKQFICSHGDGSLTIWNCKTPAKPHSYLMPHAKLTKDGKPEPCKPITKVDYRSVRNSEAYILFSGGTPLVALTPSLTVMHGNNMTVLEMEHAVVDFVTLCSTPYNNDFQDPYAIVVLLENDLVVVDLNSQGYPCFENPYAMDIHESPVTVCSYFADCPSDLIGAYCWVGCKYKRTGYSDKQWPINGGERKETSCSFPEIVITGHADGSLKFWDASAVTFQVLYKLKTAKLFDPSKCRSVDDDDSPFAIQHIHLCVESRLLCIAGYTHVVLFRFSTQETSLECPVLEVSIVYEICDGVDTPELEFPIIFPKQSLGSVSQQSGSLGSAGNAASNGKETTTSVRTKTGVRKWPAGYQPDLCCLLTWMDREPAPPITSLSVNSRFGLLAFGDECGIAIIDIIQKTCLLSMGTPDLYGSMDPYSRAPRSPKLKSQPKLAGFDFSTQGMNVEDCKSPTVEQNLPDLQCIPSHPKDPTVADMKPRTPAPGNVAPKQKVFSYGLESILEQSGQHLQDSTNVDSDLSTGDELSVSSKSADPPPGSGQKLECEVQAPPEPEAIVNPAENSPVESGREPVKSEQRYRKSSGLEHKESNKVTRGSSLLSRLSHRKKREVFSTSKSLSDETFAPHTDVDCFTATLIRPVTAAILTSSESLIDVLGHSLTDDHSLLHSQSSYKSSRSDIDDGSLSDGGYVGKRKREGTGLVRMFSEKFLQRSKSDIRNRVPKAKVVDFSEDEVLSKPPVRKLTYSEYCLLDRTDNSFSRSHSSSTTSLENVNKEAIECLVFADAYARKSETATSPCLWVGTSLGTVLVISLSLPSDADNRRHEPVIVSPSGTIFRLKGAILAMSFLDCNGILIPTVADQWKDVARDEKKAYNRQQSALVGKTRMSPTSSIEMTTDRQFAIICSEKQARVIYLPSQTCAYKVKITETSSVMKADIISMRDSVCLACYIANGHIMTFGLPSLKPLLDVDYIPFPDIRVARTLCFSNSGSMIYMCSPSEIQKLTLSSDIWEAWKDVQGDLFLPCNMPEAPKQGFLRNLFVGTPVAVDREELFGEGSGKASKMLTKYTPGPAGMAQAQESSAYATSEIGRAKMAALERGEKLGELEERTERMRLDAEQYSQSAHQLKMKYNKKWYQF